jgi:hypothetical protein
MKRQIISCLLLSALLFLTTGCGGTDPAADSAGGDGSAPVAKADAASDNGKGSTPQNGSPPTGAASNAGRFDSSFISDDFFAAVVVRPRQALESRLAAKITKRPADGSLPPDLAAALDNFEKGKQVEQVILLLGPGPGGRSEMAPVAMPKVSSAAIIRFNSAELCRQMVDGMPTQGEPRMHAGKKYNMQMFAGAGTSNEIEVPTDELDARLAELKKGNEGLAAEPGVEVTYDLRKSDDGKTTTITVSFHRGIDDPAFPNARYLPDEKTVVFAREDLLKKMIEAKDAKSPLLDRLASLGGDHDLVAVFLGESLRQPLNEIVDGLPPVMVPPQVQQFVKLVDGVNVLTITAGADASPLATVEIEAADAAAAKSVHEALDPLLTMGKGMVPALIESASASDLPPSVQPLLAVAGDLVKDLSLTQNGTRVVFTAPRPTSLDGVDDWLGPLAQLAEREQRRARLEDIAGAIQQVMDENGPLPQNIYAEGGETPLLSWRVDLLPALGQFDAYQQFNREEAWDAEHNRPLLEVEGVFGQPLPFTSSPGVKPGHTVYLTFQGKGAMIDGKQPKTSIDLKDGISGTVAVVEVSPERAVPWTQPVDLDLAAADVATMLGPPPTKQGYPAVLFDGRIVTLPADIDIETLRKLAGFDDGVPPGYEPEF